MLIPDFQGIESSLRTVLDAGPDVLNHNIETVPRLYRMARSGGRYPRSLELLDRSRRYRPDIATKTGIMVGLGEERDEILTVFDDLRRMGVSILTIGQYLTAVAGARDDGALLPSRRVRRSEARRARQGIRARRVRPAGALVVSRPRAGRRVSTTGCSLVNFQLPKIDLHSLQSFWSGPDVLWEILRRTAHTTLKSSAPSRSPRTEGYAKGAALAAFLLIFGADYNHEFRVDHRSHPCTLFIGSEPLLAAWNARAKSVETVIPVAHTDLSQRPGDDRDEASRSRGD